MEYLLILCGCIWIYKNEDNVFGRVLFEKKNAFYLAAFCLITQIILTALSKSNIDNKMHALIILSNRTKKINLSKTFF